MPVEDDEDRAMFIDEDEHGVVVNYTTQALAVSTFNAIFDNEYEGVGAGEFAEIASRTPQITMRSSDLPAGGGEGDTLIISGVTYRRVGEIEDDGTGMALMRLSLP